MTLCSDAFIATARPRYCSNKNVAIMRYGARWTLSYTRADGTRVYEKFSAAIKAEPAVYEQWRVKHPEVIDWRENTDDSAAQRLAARIQMRLAPARWTAVVEKMQAQMHLMFELYLELLGATRIKPKTLNFTQSASTASLVGWGNSVTVKMAGTTMGMRVMFAPAVSADNTWTMQVRPHQLDLAVRAQLQDALAKLPELAAASGITLGDVLNGTPYSI